MKEGGGFRDCIYWNNAVKLLVEGSWGANNVVSPAPALRSSRERVTPLLYAWVHVG